MLPATKICSPLRCPLIAKGMQPYSRSQKVGISLSSTPSLEKKETSINRPMPVFQLFGVYCTPAWWFDHSMPHKRNSSAPFLTAVYASTLFMDPEDHINTRILQTHDPPMLGHRIISFEDTPFYTTPIPKRWPRQGLIKAYLDLMMGWGWY